RERGAALILARITSLPENVPVVLVGDLNDVPGSATHRALPAVLDDAWKEAPRRVGPEGTCHGFSGEAERRIGWVLSRGLHVREGRHVDARVGGVLPSDHYPVVAGFGWGR